MIGLEPPLKKPKLQTEMESVSPSTSQDMFATSSDDSSLNQTATSETLATSVTANGIENQTDDVYLMNDDTLDDDGDSIGDAETDNDGKDDANAMTDDITTEDDVIDYVMGDVAEGAVWEGCPVAELPRVGISAPSQYPPVEPSRYHTVCVKLPLQQGKLEPSPEKLKDIWDYRYVRTPWSKDSRYLKISENGNRFLQSRWRMIQEAFAQPILTFGQLKQAILSYNTRNASDWSWSYENLQELLEDCTDEERDQFFNRTLPGIIQLCLSGPRVLTRPLPLLAAGQSAAITLSQEQCAVLLANAFLATFPRRNNRGGEYANYPDINMNRMLSCHVKEGRGEAQQEKIKCILAYFAQVIDSPPQGLITYTRQKMQRRELPRWRSSSARFRRLHISSEGTIEKEGQGMLQVDFANRVVGGGVLGQGLVQEEIRFTVCPELIVARLFTEALDDHEVLIIHGAQQFADFQGYGDTFRFRGRFRDSTPTDVSRRRNTSIVAMDALHIGAKDSQFWEKNILRELDKAYIGFTNREASKLCAVATGNWGCGAFRGDPRLKFLLQLMAAAQAGRDVCYFTFGDVKLVRDGYALYNLLIEREVTVGQLFSLLGGYRPPFHLYRYLTSQILEPGGAPVSSFLLLEEQQTLEVIQMTAIYSADTDDENDEGQNSKSVEATGQWHENDQAAGNTDHRSPSIDIRNGEAAASGNTEDIEQKGIAAVDQSRGGGGTTADRDFSEDSPSGACSTGTGGTESSEGTSTRTDNTRTGLTTVAGGTGASAQEQGFPSSVGERAGASAQEQGFPSSVGGGAGASAQEQGFPSSVAGGAGASAQEQGFPSSVAGGAGALAQDQGFLASPDSYTVTEAGPVVQGTQTSAPLSENSSSKSAKKPTGNKSNCDSKQPKITDLLFPRK